jgi:hypothetical protein
VEEATVFDPQEHRDGTPTPAGGGCATKAAPAPEVAASGGTEDIEGAVRWLHAEFPGWKVSLDRTAGWEGSYRALWIARREGHHPQAELSAAKLHSRLTDYLAREARRGASRN